MRGQWFGNRVSRHESRIETSSSPPLPRPVFPPMSMEQMPACVKPGAGPGSETDPDPDSSYSVATTDPKCRRVLTWGSGSPPAWRVRLLLEEKAIPYRSNLVSFESNVLKSPQMLSLNPRGLVPIFVDDDVVL